VTAREIPPVSLAASYHERPGRPADGYPAVSRLLLRRLGAGLPPAAAVTVCSSGGVCYEAAGGWANLGHGRGARVPASSGTLFDLASLTKVVATVPLVLLLRQRRAWDLDDPVAKWLPGAPQSAVTIRQCLTHTSGLVWHRPFFAEYDSPAAIRSAVQAELAAAVPGRVCYSDLGFMLLGWAVENCAGEALDTLVRRELLAPLGMTRTAYRPQASLTEIAATEVGGDQRRQAEAIWGEVHDGNAYAMGGISGHAGLFGPVDDLGRFAAALLRPEAHPVLSAETIRLMTTRQAAIRGDVRALGWRLAPPGWGAWPEGTFWHTGFTGTSVLVSPGADTAVVLLTNSVHPVRRLAETAQLQAQLHRAVRRACAASAPGTSGRAGEAADSHVTLRRGRAEDAAALAEVFVAAWHHGYPGIVPDDVIATVDLAAATGILADVGGGQASTTAIAEIGGTAAAYIQYGPDAEAGDESTGYVAALYVRPEHSGRGAGRCLLSHAIAELSRQGRDCVRLWVFAANTRARSLYSSAGFRPDGAELTDPRWQTPQIRMRRDPAGDDPPR
jgi:CubicO group peptidase (beta-lactamase class C family)